MKKPKVFTGKNGDRNLLIAIALAGAVGVYLYKKKQEKGATISGLLPAYRG
jgi:LPXTG-motif cell wall-anchored protein